MISQHWWPVPLVRKGLERSGSGGLMGQATVLGPAWRARCCSVSRADLQSDEIDVDRHRVTQVIVAAEILLIARSLALKFVLLAPCRQRGLPKVGEGACWV